ncbi:hypothetical protein F2P79_013011 [Pimephales promelas]|nr:hypothetical protein F2P79_013011 [Pimephales promelas]
MSSRSFDESSKTKRFWDALGPFPRSTWIHSHTPEDSRLDRACGRVLKRSILVSRATQKHIKTAPHSGYVELGRSADGTHMAQTPAGSSTGSVKNAAGPLDNAQCHIYHKNTTVTKTETTDISLPENMDGIQPRNSSGRCPLQSAPFITGTGHGPQSPWLLPANSFLRFFEVQPKPKH